MVIVDKQMQDYFFKLLKYVQYFSTPPIYSAL